MRNEIFNALRCFSIPDLVPYKFDRFIGGLKRSAIGTFTGFRHAGVDDAALSRRVLVTGGRQPGHDIDHAPGNLEFHLLAVFETGPATSLRGTINSDFDVMTTLIALTISMI